MIAVGQPIKVACRQCGRKANSNEFVLDPYFKQMVCPQCVKERRTGQEVRQEVAAMREASKKEEAAKARPAGYDIEDDYLDRAYRAKVESQVKVRKIDEEKVEYKCPKCKYSFIYNTEKKSPGRCPFCSTDVYRITF